MWEPFDDVPPIHPATLLQVLGMIGAGNGWRSKTGIVGHLGAEAGGRWCETPIVAAMMGISSSRCRVYLRELELERVIWRDGGGRDRPHLFWCEVNPDPTAWRGVPWRIADSEDGARVALELRLARIRRPVEEPELRAAALRLIARPKGVRSAGAIARWGARYVDDEPRDPVGRSRGGVRDRLRGLVDVRTPHRAIGANGSRGWARDHGAPDLSRGLGAPSDVDRTRSLGEEQGARGDTATVARALLERAHVVDPGRHDLRGRPRLELVRLLAHHGLEATLEAVRRFPEELGVPMAVRWVGEYLEGGAMAAAGGELEADAGEAAALEAEARRLRGIVANLEAAGLSDADLDGYRADLRACETLLYGTRS